MFRNSLLHYGDYILFFINENQDSPWFLYQNSVHKVILNNIWYLVIFLSGWLIIYTVVDVFFLDVFFLPRRETFISFCFLDEHMEQVHPLETEFQLISYAKSLAHKFFAGVHRKTGLPYTTDHLQRMAETASDILLPSKYRDPAIAAAWLHDAVEDIGPIDVYHPFLNPPELDPDKTYLNKLLANAHFSGALTSYLVNKLTHRGGIPYFDYIMAIFTFDHNGTHPDTKIVAAILKLIDRFLNTNPDETRNVDELLREYRSLDFSDGEAVKDFLKKTKTFDAFLEKGTFYRDDDLFVSTLETRFQAQQEAIAIDNLSLYLPLAEQKLLIDVGTDNGIFDWHKLRALLKSVFLDSIKLYPGVDSIHIVRKLGANKRRTYPDSYTPILVEIRNDFYS